MRLNKYIASAGIASRREADKLIENGFVTVNGKTAELGMDVKPDEDHVKVNGKLIHPDNEMIYLLLYKPVSYLCTRDDPSKRPVVYDLLKEYRKHRLFTIGRLDFNSEGIIIVTNDGDFAEKVGHPRSGPVKHYEIKVRGIPEEKTLEKLQKGIRLNNYKLKPSTITLKRSAKNSWLDVLIKEGRNRQIRNMFQAMGHPVMRLRRTKIGEITSKGLKPGQYRLLTPNEVARLTGS